MLKKHILEITRVQNNNASQHAACKVLKPSTRSLENQCLPSVQKQDWHCQRAQLSQKPKQNQGNLSGFPRFHSLGQAAHPWGQSPQGQQHSKGVSTGKRCHTLPWQESMTPPSSTLSQGLGCEKAKVHWLPKTKVEKQAEKGGTGLGVP